MASQSTISAQPRRIENVLCVLSLKADLTAKTEMTESLIKPELKSVYDSSVLLISRTQKLVLSFKNSSIFLIPIASARGSCSCLEGSKVSKAKNVKKLEQTFKYKSFI